MEIVLPVDNNQLKFLIKAVGSRVLMQMGAMGHGYWTVAKVSIPDRGLKTVTYVYAGAEL